MKLYGFPPTRSIRVLWTFGTRRYSSGWLPAMVDCARSTLHWLRQGEVEQSASADSM